MLEVGEGCSGRRETSDSVYRRSCCELSGREGELKRDRAAERSEVQMEKGIEHKGWDLLICELWTAVSS